MFHHDSILSCLSEGILLYQWWLIEDAVFTVYGAEGDDGLALSALAQDKPFSELAAQSFCDRVI